MIAEDRALPNLVVIGAQKCGTSALHYYLGLHPEVSMSAPKELNFFCGEPEPPPAMDGLDRRTVLAARRFSNWQRGPGWYASHFDGGAPVRGEASPVYTAPWQPRVAERMAALVPQARLIMLVRDPLEQIPAQWLQARAYGFEPRPLAAVAAGPGCRYVARAAFRARLQPFLERFGPQRILICDQRDLLLDRRATLRRVFAFLGVDADYWSDRFERRRQETASRTRRARLLDRLQYGTALGRLAAGMPQELKWRVERLARIGARPRPAAELSREQAAGVREWLADDVAALRELSGLPLAGWLEPTPASGSAPAPAR